MHRITFQSNACYRGVTLDGEDRSGRIEGEEPLQRLAALQRLPEAKVTEGVSIDDYSTWRAVRFADPDEIG